ncbi:hypothetical protein ES703_70993 [subsurface metagenome]
MVEISNADAKSARTLFSLPHSGHVTVSPMGMSFVSIVAPQSGLVHLIVSGISVPPRQA